MRKQSAGLLVFRKSPTGIEVLLVHPGGPFWAKKDKGAWSIPKGEFKENEDPFQSAQREFTEETGLTVQGNPIPLTPLKQTSGKQIYAWAIESDLDLSQFKSNTFSMEWPPHSGKFQEFPEVDRAAWFPLDIAKQKIVGGQVGFLVELEKILSSY